VKLKECAPFPLIGICTLFLPETPQQSREENQAKTPKLIMGSFLSSRCEGSLPPKKLINGPGKMAGII
jgi:hypothetical protein